MEYHLAIYLCAIMIGQEPECVGPYLMRDYVTGRIEEYSNFDICRGAKTSTLPHWQDALRITNQDRTNVRGACVEVKG